MYAWLHHTGPQHGTLHVHHVYMASQGGMMTAGSGSIVAMYVASSCRWDAAGTNGSYYYYTGKCH